MLPEKQLTEVIRMLMAGFRSIAVHSYQELNLDVLKKLIEEKMNDFTSLTEVYSVIIDKKGVIRCGRQEMIHAPAAAGKNIKNAV